MEEILAGNLVVKTFNQQARAEASIHEVNKNNTMLLNVLNL